MVKRSGPDIPVAKVNFWTAVNGRRLLIRAGEAWAADDPVVVDNPGKFESLRIHTSDGGTLPVERPTDSPHEAPAASA